jgi:hypothetical protein
MCNLMPSHYNGLIVAHCLTRICNPILCHQSSATKMVNCHVKWRMGITSKPLCPSSGIFLLPKKNNSSNGFQLISSCLTLAGNSTMKPYNTNLASEYFKKIWLGVLSIIIIIIFIIIIIIIYSSHINTVTENQPRIMFRIG